MDATLVLTERYLLCCCSAGFRTRTHRRSKSSPRLVLAKCIVKSGIALWTLEARPTW